MVLRLLNPQGVAGIAASLCLALLLMLQHGETRHWRKQSSQYEQLYRHSEATLSGTIANYRAAADKARADDVVNADRVRAEQARINGRTSNDYEARLAAARARADELRSQAGIIPTNPSASGAAPVPGLSASAGGSAEAAQQDRLPDALLATEQAIQLDELIKWVRAQSKVDVNGPSSR